MGDSHGNPTTCSGGNSAHPAARGRDEEKASLSNDARPDVSKLMDMVSQTVTGDDMRRALSALRHLEDRLQTEPGIILPREALMSTMSLIKTREMCLVVAKTNANAHTLRRRGSAPSQESLAKLLRRIHDPPELPGGIRATLEVASVIELLAAAAREDLCSSAAAIIPEMIPFLSSPRETVREAVSSSVEALLMRCHSPGVLRAVTSPLTNSKKPYLRRKGSAMLRLAIENWPVTGLQTILPPVMSLIRKAIFDGDATVRREGRHTFGVFMQGWPAEGRGMFYALDKTNQRAILQEQPHVSNFVRGKPGATTASSPRAGVGTAGEREVARAGERGPRQSAHPGITNSHTRSHSAVSFGLASSRQLHHQLQKEQKQEQQWKRKELFLQWKSHQEAQRISPGSTSASASAFPSPSPCPSPSPSATTPTSPSPEAAAGAGLFRGSPTNAAKHTPTQRRKRQISPRSLSFSPSSRLTMAERLERRKQNMMSPTVKKLLAEPLPGSATRAGPQGSAGGTGSRLWELQSTPGSSTVSDLCSEQGSLYSNGSRGAHTPSSLPMSTFGSELSAPSAGERGKSDVYEKEEREEDKGGKNEEEGEMEEWEQEKEQEQEPVVRRVLFRGKRAEVGVGPEGSPINPAECRDGGIKNGDSSYRWKSGGRGGGSDGEPPLKRKTPDRPSISLEPMSPDPLSPHLKEGGVAVAADDCEHKSPSPLTPRGGAGGGWHSRAPFEGSGALKGRNGRSPRAETRHVHFAPIEKMGGGPRDNTSDLEALSSPRYCSPLKTGGPGAKGRTGAGAGQSALLSSVQLSQGHGEGPGAVEGRGTGKGEATTQHRRRWGGWCFVLFVLSMASLIMAGILGFLALGDGARGGSFHDTVSGLDHEALLLDHVPAQGQRVVEGARELRQFLERKLPTSLQAFFDRLQAPGTSHDAMSAGNSNSNSGERQGWGWEQDEGSPSATGIESCESSWDSGGGRDGEEGEAEVRDGGTGKGLVERMSAAAGAAVGEPRSVPGTLHFGGISPHVGGDGRVAFHPEGPVSEAWVMGLVPPSKVEGGEEEAALGEEVPQDGLGQVSPEGGSGATEEGLDAFPEAVGRTIIMAMQVAVGDEGAGSIKVGGRAPPQDVPQGGSDPAVALSKEKDEGWRISRNHQPAEELLDLPRDPSILNADALVDVSHTGPREALPPCPADNTAETTNGQAPPAIQEKTGLPEGSYYAPADAVPSVSLSWRRGGAALSVSAGIMVVGLWLVISAQNRRGSRHSLNDSKDNDINVAGEGGGGGDGVPVNDGMLDEPQQEGSGDCAIGPISVWQGTGNASFVPSFETPSRSGAGAGEGEESGLGTYTTVEMTKRGNTPAKIRSVKRSRRLSSAQQSPASGLIVMDLGPNALSSSS